MSDSVAFKRRPAKNIKSRRALKKYEAKIFENPKKVLLLRGERTSQVVNDAMTDLALILKPHTKKLAKRNAFHPFEGRQHLEFLGFKNDCSLFAFTSDSKKRPHNLTLGRHYNFHTLDMIEFGLLAMDPYDASNIKNITSCSLGAKPCFVFEGQEFVADPFFMRLRNFFIDFFQGASVSEVNLRGLEHVIYVTLRSKDGDGVVTPPPADGPVTAQARGTGCVVCFRHYGIVTTAAPLVGGVMDAKNVKLVDVGPNFDLEVRRHSFASGADFKRACRQPKQAMAHSKSLHENVGQDIMGNLRGQLHVGTQDLSELGLRRFAGHRRGKRPAAADGADDAAEGGAPPAAAAEGGERRVGGKSSRGGDDATAGAERPSRKRKRASGTAAADDILPDI